MRLVVLGAVSGNGGDAAILAAQLQAVRSWAADPVTVEVVDYNPAVTHRVVDGVDAVIPMSRTAASAPARRRTVLSRVVSRLRGLLASLRAPGAAEVDLRLPSEQVLAAIERADVLLYTGGTSLVEHYALGEKLVQLRLALLAGKPLVLGTQSLGPFRRPEHADLVRRIVAGSRAVLLRDERSRRHLAEIGAPLERAHVLPDVVFALADPGDRRLGDGVLRVAVSTRNWVHFSSRDPREGRRLYVQAVREAVTWLVRDRSAEVVFVSTCQGLPEYHTDDSLMAEEIAGGLPPDVRGQVRVRRDNVPPAALQELYAGFDLVLATRMHAAILALNAGTPVVAVAYEFKTTELFANLGLPELAHDIEDVTGEGLIGSLRQALDTADTGLRDRITGAVGTWRTEAAALGRFVVEAAASGGPAEAPRRADGAG